MRAGADILHTCLAALAVEAGVASGTQVRTVLEARRTPRHLWRAVRTHAGIWATNVLRLVVVTGAASRAHVRLVRCAEGRHMRVTMVAVADVYDATIALFVVAGVARCAEHGVVRMATRTSCSRAMRARTRIRCA